MAQATRLLDEMLKMAGLEVLLSPARHLGQEKTRYDNLEEENFAALAAVLGPIKGKFLLSLGDHQ